VERRALRMAKIATGGTDDALDLVQDAMLKLVKGYAGRSEAEWGPLFHRILQRRIYDWHRRKRVRERFRVWLGAGEEGNADPMQDLPAVDQCDTAREVSNQRAAAALEAALHSLPIRQQQAFLLRQWEGQDVAQTARIMGCSEGSVKTHYSRAVHALRERLEDHWP